jgi:hypothetical protein
MDDDQERRGRRQLLGKGALVAERWARPLVAELDETEQRATRSAGSGWLLPSRMRASPLVRQRKPARDELRARVGARSGQLPLLCPCHGQIGWASGRPRGRRAGQHPRVGRGRRYVGASTGRPSARASVIKRLSQVMSAKGSPLMLAGWQCGSRRASATLCRRFAWRSGRSGRWPAAAKPASRRGASGVARGPGTVQRARVSHARVVREPPEGPSWAVDPVRHPRFGGNL